MGYPAVRGTASLTFIKQLEEDSQNIWPDASDGTQLARLGGHGRLASGSGPSGGGGGNPGWLLAR